MKHLLKKQQAHALGKSGRLSGSISGYPVRRAEATLGSCKGGFHIGPVRLNTESGYRVSEDLKKGGATPELMQQTEEVISEALLWPLESQKVFWKLRKVVATTSAPPPP